MHGFNCIKLNDYREEATRRVTKSSCRRAPVASLALIGILGGFPAAAVAQCESRADATPVDYVEYREGRFTICYSIDYPDDLLRGSVDVAGVRPRR